MKHILFALFDDPAEAESAIQELDDSGMDHSHYSVILHRGALKQEELDLTETDAREGLVDGALLGGLAGALASSLLAGPVGLLGLGWLAAAAFGAGAGSAYGALGAALVGAGIPDRTLEKWAAEVESGKVLVTVKVDSFEREERIETLFKRHGALEVRKPMA